MHDTELYRYLLGLESPWEVSRVELSVTEGRVDAWAAHPKGARFSCPECDCSLTVYDHVGERIWRHLDSCQFLTFLHARAPRVECPTHGVRQVALPWAEPLSRFTVLFERLAIDVLKECDVEGACRIPRISWDEGWHLMERAVARGLLRRPVEAPVHLGVDEKAAGRGQDYITVVSDVDAGTVRFIADERKEASLDAYFDSMPAEQLARIEAVAMDMWEPYANSVRAHLDKADEKIVFDRFHLMGHMGKAVDTVRKDEHRQLKADGDNLLAGTKYLWLHSAENLPERHGERFAALQAVELKTGRAWAIKEDLRYLWDYVRRGWAEKHWQRWYFWATHSRLQPVIEVARMIKRHYDGVMAFFAHRLTSATAEGINSRIQAIRVQARGYRNRENFKTAIYFHLGGLKLYPSAA
ncbi:MAG: ISL3 family transposase [Actinomycetota bacterium]|jgi:transposase|nr:ISL3 family transposase [Actinomycetota bacterium]